MSWINIDVDMDDVINSMGSYDKQKMVDELYDDGYVPVQLKGTLADTDDDTDWNIAVNKLKNTHWKLSKEDEETILRITNKLV